MPVGLTTASEFGGLNVSVTKLNGVTHNPWRHGRTVGGSSAGSAAAVAGGLVPLATGGDGGGSIRIPAGYTGLLGMKGTYGRIPRGPHAYFRPGTVVLGCLARSVRDAARYFDVCGGYDALDPWSLPARPAGKPVSARNDLRGRRVAIVPALGGVTLEPGVEEHLRALGRDADRRDRAWSRSTSRSSVPNLAAQWMMGNLATLLADLGDRWPRCAADLTDEITVGLLLAQSMYNLHTAAVAEEQRIRANEAMAAAFDEVDFVIAATNPGPAFAADATMSSPTASFIDWAQVQPVAQLGFRGVMGGVRLAGGRVPEAAVGAARHRHRSASPTSCTWARSRSSRTSTATPRSRSPAASSTASPSACRCSPATTPTNCSSTSRSRSNAKPRGRSSHRLRPLHGRALPPKLAHPRRRLPIMAAPTPNRRPTEAETAERRVAYRATYEAQRRAARDPQLMATLSDRIAELNEKYPRADE